MTERASVASIVPIACMAWEHRGVFCTEPEEGRICRYCDRAIAAPISAKGKPVCCIYCGLERGLVEPVEVEPWTHREP